MPAPYAGERIPEVELEDWDGNAVSLRDWRGKPIILIFLRDPG